MAVTAVGRENAAISSAAVSMVVVVVVEVIVGDCILLY
jgi:hypothetical protein